MMDEGAESKFRRLQGPILVLGGSGFIGANLFRLLLTARDDVYATTSGKSNWRLEGLPRERILDADLLAGFNLERILNEVRPRTVFNCLAYGAYSFERDFDRIYQTNFILTGKILRIIQSFGIAAYVHAGSSSEYGDNASGPLESAYPSPNSDYSVSKIATSQLLSFWGRKHELPCANLRLYSCYGPLEDSSRLIPTLVRLGASGQLPPFVHPEVSHDFVWIEDVCSAFVDCALNLMPEDFGESFNIGTGQKTSIRDVAAISQEVFGFTAAPQFGAMATRAWDVHDWYANCSKAKERIAWTPTVSFREGLLKTAAWFSSLEDKERYQRVSKRFSPSRERSLSAIVACYKDAQAIPIMHQRLTAVLTKLNIEYEIIFVNDGSPDNSADVIREISSTDSAVVGVTHSRNFGSQAAFSSGMQISTKNGCVLLDGDLQDPPELIESFFGKWLEGFDVVYGERVDRDEGFFFRLACKVFYRIFNKLSSIRIPRDAGDFSLIDRRVVVQMLRCGERDLFLRGVRAFVGFRQIGVPYVRPKRMFGVSTNNLLRNIGWAKKGILSYSNTPLNILSLAGVVLFALSILLGLTQLALRIMYPALAPRGITTLLLMVIFFGSINLVSLALLGEYVGKIFEEVKRRPLFIRKALIRGGKNESCDAA